MISRQNVRHSLHFTWKHITLKILNRMRELSRTEARLETAFANSSSKEDVFMATNAGISIRALTAPNVNSEVNSWPSCNFAHYEVCQSYQECRNQRCPLEHPRNPFLANVRMNLPPDLNSQTSFPNLQRRY